MMSLNCQMVLSLCQIFKIILIEYIIKKHETIPVIHVFINRINKRLVIKIKDRYKLELQTPETIKLFGSTKKLIDKSKTEKKYQALK